MRQSSSPLKNSFRLSKQTRPPLSPAKEPARYVEEILKKLSELIKNNNSVGMAERVSKAVKEQYSWNLVAQKWLEDLNGLLTKKQTIHDYNTVHSALKFYQAGSLQQAATILITILETHPDNVDALLALAFICSELKNHDLAMTCIDSVIKINENTNLLKCPFNSFNDKTFRETISLCMIVKNEENNLIKCLMHTKSIVHEIIIIDTGSTDSTNKIAHAFGAKVFDFKWTNNYSDARNFSIQKATGKWILHLDADEIISFIDHEAFKDTFKKVTSDAVAFSFIRRNYVTQTNVSGWKSNDGHYLREEAGAGFFTDDVVRLFPNNQHILFTNPVHEHIEPSLITMGIEIKKCNITIHHYGLLNEEKLYAKKEYYYNLGKIQIEENGNVDFRVLYDFAVQTSALGKYEEAVEYFRKVIDLKPNFPLAYKSMGNTFFNLQRYEDAKSCYKKAIELDQNLMHEILMYPLCEIYTGNAEEAISYIEELIRQDPTNLHYILISAVANICIGNKNKGIEYLSKLDAINYIYKTSLINIKEKLNSLNNFKYASLLEDIV